MNDKPVAQKQVALVKNSYYSTAVYHLQETLTAMFRGGASAAQLDELELQWREQIAKALAGRAPRADP